MKVVNLRNFTREQRDRLSQSDADVTRIDRATRWGNPFKIGDPDPNGHPLSRGAVISMYRRYAESKLQSESDWLEPLRGRTLACWCAPLACHGDVIIDLLRKSAG